MQCILRLKHCQLCIHYKCILQRKTYANANISHCHVCFKRSLITAHEKNRTHAQNQTKLSWSWYLHDNVCFAAKSCVSITNGINSLQHEGSTHTRASNRRSILVSETCWNSTTTSGAGMSVTDSQNAENIFKLLLFFRPWEKSFLISQSNIMTQGNHLYK